MKTIQTHLFAVLVASGVALASGCGGDTGSETQDSATTPTASEAQPTTTDTPPGQLSAAHILIMHVDSARVPGDITRTKEEALALAEEVAVKAKAEALKDLL